MLVKHILKGAAAGAAGTTALNAVTYLDMVARGRPASSTPETTVERLSELTGVGVPGTDEERQARLTGLGALSGLAAGVGAGALLGGLRPAGVRPGPVSGALLASAVAALAGNAPMAALGVSNPREWSAGDWAADLVPHLAYGAVTWIALTAMEKGVRSRG